MRLAAPPAILGLAALLLWQGAVRLFRVPDYILPGPVAIAATLWRDGGTLFASLLVTLAVALAALAAAIIGGAGLAILFAQSKWLERALFPYAVVLQVTPVIAIAPLILIYVRSTEAALLICASIVAFFPVLASTTLGLNSADHNMLDLMALYRARRWQVLWYLRLPAALPHFLAGARIAGGLALIGAVVAEFAAGTAAGGSGLAWRILESSYRLDLPRMYAALFLLSLAGVVIFAMLSLVSWLLLHRWHDSAARREP
ncbi:MAG: ABC transporter permease subunit [Rhodospirillales bacterium]|nr:ABC transporter permease subunit [Rhodospirillales bacterium]